jgi:ABC-type branched-subunit amino acid transport system ATPase component/ABC-type branched-subunit amino acid transport system permease subunit
MYRRPAAVAVGAGLVVVVGAALAPIVGGEYFVVVVGQAAAFAVAVIGYNLIVGEAGLFSLGHAAFMGIGLYVYVIAANHGWSSAAAIAASLVGTVVVALVVGGITLRLRDVYFAIATFCAAGIFQNVISQLTTLTGGDEGIAVPPFTALGITLAGSDALYPWVIGSVVGAVVLHEVITNSRFGRRLRCIRDDESAADAMGIHVFTHKLAVFVISALFAAWGGLLYGLSLSYVDPTLLGVNQTVLILVMLVIGGTGTVIGALIGAFLIWLTPQVLQPLAIWWQFTYGLVVLVSVLVARAGLAGVGSAAWRRVMSLARRGSNKRAGASAKTTWTYHVPSPETRSMAELSATKVTKRFGGVTALDGVTVQFEPGIVNAIIGPNGSGKSTLVNVMTGALKPNSGDVHLASQRLTALPPHIISRAGISRTYQSPRLFRQLSVFDNVLPMAEITAKKTGSARTLAHQCLASVGLDDYADKAIGELAQGYLRLLEIARALALQPRAILLDEPAAGLSEHEWRDLQRLLSAMAEAGLIVVVIEHNMPFVLNVAQRISVLQLGRVIAVGTPAEIQANSEVRAAYLGEDVTNLASAQ